MRYFCETNYNQQTIFLSSGSCLLSRDSSKMAEEGDSLEIILSNDKFHTHARITLKLLIDILSAQSKHTCTNTFEVPDKTQCHIYCYLHTPRRGGGGGGVVGLLNTRGRN